MTATTFVIIGAGLAGAKAAEALREEGFGDRIILIGDEAEEPYERPPLSKGYLQGKQERGKMFVHPSQWYVDQDIDLLLDVAATDVDRSRRRVSLADGHSVGYDALLLATGAVPRRPPIAGSDLDRVLYLRRVEDCERIKELFRDASRIAFVGGGWIGLEVAAAAREAGVQACVLEADPLPLARVLGPEMARVFADLHRDHGVDLRTHAQVAGIVDRGGRAAGVLLTDGTRLDADAVVIGVGVLPNTDLAVGCGLTTDNGVMVDASMQTSDPKVYAVGDLADAFHPWVGKHIRVEHWDSARRQPAVAARSMLGRDAVYDRVPYFFTDQYDLGMEFSGYLEPGGYDEVVVRGDLGRREFMAFWLKTGRIRAGMNVNIWDVNDQIEQLVRARTRVERTALADGDTPLDALLER